MKRILAVALLTFSFGAFAADAAKPEGDAKPAAADAKGAKGTKKSGKAPKKGADKAATPDAAKPETK